jgi:hypothetical protein
MLSEFTISHMIVMQREGLLSYPDEKRFCFHSFNSKKTEHNSNLPDHFVDETGASYMFPDWPGPWDDLD